MQQILINYIKRFTNISDDEIKKIADDIPVVEYKKGTLLIEQGEISNKCFFVLQGCVRQYAVNENGKETTFDFLTEEQSVAMFNDHMENKESLYSFECIENCVLIVGNNEISERMYEKYDKLDSITRKMTEENIGKIHEEYATFVALGPEERYKRLLKKRPELPARVPQHQLASYLGVTPESLSRIKKRVKIENEKQVD